VAQVIEAIRRHGAPERCIFVVAGAADAPGLQWIAPFAGFTIAEYFRDRGQHALIVVDDLTKHAATHRQIALLTGQPPGREAFPGDIFYLHSRLLERAGKLSPGLGGGSLTALPIAETEAGNLSAYVPTNLISITDGQIVLDAALFQEGQKPAVDVGTSVSRVGGKTQAPALRQVSGTLRLDYAQFLELESFTRFGWVSESRVKTQLARGERMRRLLSQPRFAILRMVDEVALALALREGILDTMPCHAMPCQSRRWRPFAVTCLPGSMSTRSTRWSGSSALAGWTTWPGTDCSPPCALWRSATPVMPRDGAAGRDFRTPRHRSATRSGGGRDARHGCGTGPAEPQPAARHPWLCGVGCPSNGPGTHPSAGG
jgi:hypothetical protein